MARPAAKRVERRPIEPNTRLWDEMGLITFSLAAGSSFLLQAMEPSIAAVVDEHSTFRTDPLGRTIRSVASVMTWIYGGDEALAEADRLRALHAKLQSVDENGVRHTALATGPWAFVMQTNAYCTLEASTYFLRYPLTPADKEALYQEFKQVWRNFGVVEKEIPDTYAELVEHVETVINDRLHESKVAREVLEVFRNPPLPQQIPRLFEPLWRLAVAPPAGVQHFILIGTPPASARRKLGLRWSRTDEFKLRLLGQTIAYGVSLLPERLRYFPIAYEARQLERNRMRLHKLLEMRPF
ncbi:oxygenase MpaB family protein [Mycobacterium kansasii]|uniref:oxygenase MpaB family protein n=1 Tax=Mycobacterium kansasii TaxID=1768 RepID=UPI0009EF7050|nr:hypothetical protein B1T50_02470 [Mycobacterium kansasii]